LLNNIKVTPLAEESIGVRSMCTLVETEDTTILLDASAALALRRLGHPPHPKEYEALAECRNRIGEAAERAEVVTISHYHFDHHTPSYTDWVTNWSSAEAADQIYGQKIVLAKSYRSKVNPSQRRRGWMFHKTGAESARRYEFADDRAYEFGETKALFSEPVFHGSKNSDLGWLIMATIIVGDERFVFASDVQGPMYTPTLEKILENCPKLVYVGGPPTYLSGFRVNEEDIEKGIQNLRSLAENVPTTILGHHLLRDKDWKNRSRQIFDAADDVGNRVVTAAEYLGKENNCLECKRGQLFESDPPSPEFKAWMKLPLQKRKLIIPPI
jgi:predicted metallo-beta-lactamase superfamily hydrolase